jgi:hypothetical protein
MNIRNVLASSLSLLLSACSISQPAVRVCSVAGVMSAGADCANTLDDKTEELNLDQWITFLEPQLDPPRGAALCMSSVDFKKVKDFIDSACAKLGTSCKKEAQETIEKVSARMERLQARVLLKKQKPIVHPVGP